jgi:hypothetical protein
MYVHLLGGGVKTSDNKYLGYLARKEDKRVWWCCLDERREKRRRGEKEVGGERREERMRGEERRSAERMTFYFRSPG